MAKISITRALAEKKLLGKRIEQHFSKFDPVAITIGQGVPPGFKSIQEFEHAAKSSYDQIKDEMARYDAIVQAIADSNAKTIVAINGKEYSVARALEKKKYLTTIGSKILAGLRKYLVEKEENFELISAHEKEKEDKEFETFIGRDKQLQEEELRVTRKIIAERHAPHYIDPLDLRKIVEKMDEEQTGFLMNVDIALTESNSRTEIDI